MMSSLAPSNEENDLTQCACTHNDGNHERQVREIGKSMWAQRLFWAEFSLMDDELLAQEPTDRGTEPPELARMILCAF